MTKRPQPVIWILHEWWDEAMIIENLRVRNIEHLSIHTVRQAMKDAAMIVFVCEAQRQLYSPSARSQVIYVGVPDPSCRYRYVALRLKAIQDSQPKTGTTSTDSSEHHVGMHRGSLSVPPPFVSEATIETRTSPSNRFVFLCLGIVCPRKNQLWTVELFQVRTAYRASTVLYDGCMVCMCVSAQEFANSLQSSDGCREVRLMIVGARETRVYEAQYLQRLRKAIAGDPRIQLFDVTDDVDEFFRQADCLVLTSLNEVTPMVISEAMSWSLPIISTNIAGTR